MFYSSDHGEDLPNTSCRLRGHGNAGFNDFTIPGLFWFSDSFVNVFPTRVKQLVENRNRPVTTEMIFETLADMGGLEFSSHDPTRSLFSPTLRDRPRLVTPLWQVDFDHAGLGKDCKTLYPRKKQTQ
jgi:glucan phosphoethanolaminetransferase (alkaline phosphatase superfamily)